MFRLSQFMKEIVAPTPLAPVRKPTGPVVIWNLVRRCNLKCKHCYSISGDVDFPGELNTTQVFDVMDDLKAFKVPVLILSGGEPLLRPDIFDISHRAKDMGFYVGLSSNGTLITKDNIDQIDKVKYNYVGVSLDGIGNTNDQFRGKNGAFNEALNGIRLAQDKGIKVGMRFTATMDNIHQLTDMLDLMETENIEKFYLSHLSYAGRGNKNRQDDAEHRTTRAMMDTLFGVAYDDAVRGGGKEFVTGNNDADGVYLLLWVKENFPDSYDHIRAKLVQWGGNSTGVNISNIDNLGDVHPDTMWWHYKIGNVKERKFGEIWSDLSDPVMAGLKQSPRKIKGRCSTCAHFDICGGNTRVRAMQLTNDPWDEDPACYLTDAEIGLEKVHPRLQVTPFRGIKNVAPAEYR